MNSVSAFQKRVYLLVGQRGSGKSFYGKRLLEQHPDCQFASRDEILVKKFGTADTDPEDGTQEYADLLLYRFARMKLSGPKNVCLILDIWTQCSKQRKFFIEMLRSYGATRVVALYFITPCDLVSTWFWLKPGVAKLEEMKERKGQGLVFFPSDGPARDYVAFHELAKSIDSDGFDEIIRIDPRQDLIALR